MQVIGRNTLFTLSAWALSLLGACGYTPSGGSTGGGATSTPSGTVSVAVRDATAQGIEAFVIDVTDIQLGQVDGTAVSLLGTPVRVDFSDLTETPLLLKSAKVPLGVYDNARITLDFRNATCVLTGQQTPASIVGEGGAPISGTLTLEIDLNESAFEVIASGQSQLTFDLDIAQSADVDPGLNQVELEPIVAVQVDGTDTQLLTYGSLLTVDTDGLTFTGTVGPLTGDPLGVATYLVNSHTVFHIDGVPSVGTTGLGLLAAAPLGTPIQVIGAPDSGTTNIFANFVVAGRGADNGGTDILEGDVIDRVGNPTSGSNVALKVFGHARNAQSNFSQFATVFTAQVNFANTKVVRSQSAQILNTDAINVGQRVRIYGTLNSNVMYANVSTAVVREEPVHALGTVTSSSVVSGQPTIVLMNLEQLELLPQNVFIWPNSGLSPPIPTALTVNAGVLASAVGLVSGTLIEVIGNFASVPDGTQDFTATSLLDLETSPSLLLVNNQTNGFTVIVVTSPTEIVLQISGTARPDERAIIDYGFAGFFQLPTTPAPTIVPAGASGTFTLRDKTTGTETAYTTFSSFSDALGQALSQGATLRTFSAVGVYSSTTNSVPATKIGAVIQ